MKVWFGLLLCLTACRCGAQEPGIVVVSVAPGSAAQKAGVQKGDRLLSYGDRNLTSPTDLEAAQANVVGKKDVTLHIRRGERSLSLNIPMLPNSGVPSSFLLPPSSFILSGLVTRPELSPAVLMLYEAGRDAQDSQQAGEAISQFSAAARAAEAAGSKEAGAWLYSQVGTIYEDQRKWKEALDAFAAAWSLVKESPDRAAQSGVLAELGKSCYFLLDFPAAERWYTQAVQVDAAAVNPIWAGMNLTMLGAVAQSEGDQAAAQTNYLRAVEIFKRLEPKSRDVALTLINLGLVAYGRHDYGAEQEYLDQANAILKEAAPDSLYAALCDQQLGILAEDRQAPGDLDTAKKDFLAALKIYERLAPDSLNVATVHNDLGLLAYHRHDLVDARQELSGARAIYERLAPESLEIGAVLQNLGVVAIDQSDLTSAQDDFSHAREIYGRLAPHSLQLAFAVNNLGLVAYRRHNIQVARSLFQDAVRIIEDQRDQMPVPVSFPDSRSMLLTGDGDAYVNLLRADLSLNDVAAAFATLERSRARSLLDMLDRRHIDLSADVPPELKRKQQDLEKRLSNAYRDLTQFDADNDRERLKGAIHDINEIDVQRGELITQIWQASPHYAQVQYPRPLDLEQSRTALDPGTLLLDYWVDTDQTYLFALTHTEAHLYRVPIRKEELNNLVGRFRSDLANGQLDYMDRACALYDLLIRPAQAEVAGAQRVLLCLDGPLHTLPFAALAVRAPGSPMARAPFFIANRPLHTVASMSVYKELREHVSPAVHPTLLALADPDYGGGERIARVADAFTALGGKLVPLPGTRKQVEEIGALFGSKEILVGKQATKAAVEGEEARNATILHFACHGLLDNHDPLASALALSPTGDKDDGMLRAYEVIQRCRLNADLVVLGACDTGLGMEDRNEGVVGLTRAFQYAGARSVLVSLWSIPEGSTSVLMVNFYRRLKEGATKDEALRQAQLSLLRGTDGNYRHPLYWAAFVLTGDWR